MMLMTAPPPQIKTCASCHFLRHGKCGAVSRLNTETRVLEHIPALEVRLDTTKCGPTAKWWSPKTCPK